MIQDSGINCINSIIRIIKENLEDGIYNPITLSGIDDEMERLSVLINRLLEIVNEQGVKARCSESVLKMIEEKYRRLEKNIPGMVYSFAMDTNGGYSFPYVSKKSEELFGLSPEDIKCDATLLTRLIHPDDYARFNLSVKHSAETLQPWRETLRHFVNGKMRWYDCMSTPELLPNGDIQWDGIILEISDHMRAMELLREREHQLSDIIAISPIGIAIYDETGQCVTVNESIARTIGTNRQQLLEENYNEVEFWNKSGLLDSAQTVVSTGLSRHNELEGFSINGKEIFLDCHLVPFGQKGLLVMCQDIWERKQFEKELTKSYNILKGVLESPRDVVIFALDRHYRYTAFNRNHYLTMKKIWGADIALGKSMLEFIKDPVDLRKAKNNFDRALSGESFTINEEYGDTALERRYYNNIYNPILDEKGDVIGLTLFLTDITERKNAENALRESEAKNRSIMENIGIGITLISPDMQVIEMNHKMREWFPSVDPAQRPICYRTFFDPPRENVCNACPVCKTFGDGLVNELTIKLQRDGITRDYRFVTSPIFNGKGEVAAVIELMEDVTDRLCLESQFRQAQKMECLGRLAGGIAHDFNNMLSVIIGYSELAMNQMSSSHPFFINLEEIRKAAKRSADLTRQLLAFAHKQIATPRVLNLNDTVEGMLKMLRRLIGEDISLDWKPDTEDKLIKIDPSQVDQILANLCVNARDAISGTGKVTIETKTAVFDEAYCLLHPEVVPGVYIILAVSDSGCGMNEEIQDRLFEPFFTTKESGKGTGLGLATVYGIVKQNKGFINFCSKPGHGTSFEIYLPCHEAGAEPVKEKNTIIPTAYDNETILLVEDESAILNIVRMMIEGIGYRVLCASSPGEAICISKENLGEISLVITDVIMPEMNGKDLVDNLIFDNPGLKCLYISGYSGDAIAQHGVLDKGPNYIQKPFSRQALAVKIREVLEG